MLVRLLLLGPVLGAVAALLLTLPESPHAAPPPGLSFRLTVPLVATDVGTPPPKVTRYSRTFPEIKCADFPPENAVQRRDLGLPDDLCLVEYPPGFPGDPTHGGGGGYNAATSEIFHIIGTGAATGGVPPGLSHEMCHAHQHWWITRMGLPAPSDGSRAALLAGYIQTPEGKAFHEAVLEVDASLIDPPWGWRDREQNDANEVEAFAEVCRAWYLPNPSEIEQTFDRFPVLRKFGETWLTGRPEGMRDQPPPAHQPLSGQLTSTSGGDLSIYRLNACPIQGGWCFGAYIEPGGVFVIGVPPGQHRLFVRKDEKAFGVYVPGGLAKSQDLGYVFEVAGLPISGITVLVP